MLGNTLIVMAGAAVSALGTRDYRFWPPAAACTHRAGAGDRSDHPAGGFRPYVIPSNAIRALVVAVPTALDLPVACGCCWRLATVRPRARGVVQRRFRLAHAIMAIGLLMVATVFIARGAETAVWLARGMTDFATQRRATDGLPGLFGGLSGRLLLLIGMVVVIFELNQP